jgi:class 3 adenylate cyclase
VLDAIDNIFRSAVPVLEAHGGTIDKFLGDAVMAVFGVPRRRRDAAPRRAAFGARSAFGDELLSRLAGCRRDPL